MQLTVYHLIAPVDKPYVGYELLQALLTAGLRYGKHAIFHRHEQDNGQGEIVFSVAQATEPGIFNMDDMGALSCQGLTFFLQSYEGDPNFSQSHALLLETIKDLADDLGGNVHKAESPVATAA